MLPSGGSWPGFCHRGGGGCVAALWSRRLQIDPLDKLFSAINFALAKKSSRHAFLVVALPCLEDSLFCSWRLIIRFLSPILNGAKHLPANDWLLFCGMSPWYRHPSSITTTGHRWDGLCPLDGHHLLSGVWLNKYLKPQVFPFQKPMYRTRSPNYLNKHRVWTEVCSFVGSEMPCSWLEYFERWTSGVFPRRHGLINQNYFHNWISSEAAAIDWLVGDGKHIPSWVGALCWILAPSPPNRIPWFDQSGHCNLSGPCCCSCMHSLLYIYIVHRQMTELEEEEMAGEEMKDWSAARIW